MSQSGLDLNETQFPTNDKSFVIRPAFKDQGFFLLLFVRKKSYSSVLRGRMLLQSEDEYNTEKIKNFIKREKVKKDVQKCGINSKPYAGM